MFLFKCFAQERKAGETSNSTNGAPDVNKIASSDIPEEEAGTKWGYDLYPERKGEKFEPSWAGYLLLGEGQGKLDKLKCEQNVVSCAKNSKDCNFRHSNIY
jgi:mitochondrial inner membrane protease ATP23